MKPKNKLVTDIVDNLRRVFQVVNEQSKRAVRETGLTGQQLWAIKLIAESGEIKVSELAKRMYLHPATVVGILDRLEVRGLVSRNRSSSDRRIVLISLAEQGKELVAGAPVVAQGLLTRGLEVLGEREIGTIATSLERLVDILGAQQISPQLFLSSNANEDTLQKKNHTPAVID
ncbi:MAG TPA: MarR family transcriptional regulator [Desulfuromonadales bacterium]|nr:MarR family transcriptional regulator [Desulfuromonadales bacterium]